MKGMSIEEYKEVIEFIQRFHKFGYIKDENRIKLNGNDFQLHIKYVDNCYDSRFSEVWVISFRGFGNHLRFAVNHFSSLRPEPDNFPFETLFDWVMSFLKGEWDDKKILKDCEVPEK